MINEKNRRERTAALSERTVHRFLSVSNVLTLHENIQIQKVTVYRKRKKISDTNQAFTLLVFRQDNSQNANDNSLQRRDRWDLRTFHICNLYVHNAGKRDDSELWYRIAKSLPKRFYIMYFSSSLWKKKKKESGLQHWDKVKRWFLSTPQLSYYCKHSKYALSTFVVF